MVLNKLQAFLAYVRKFELIFENFFKVLKLSKNHTNYEFIKIFEKLF